MNLKQERIFKNFQEKKCNKRRTERRYASRNGERELSVEKRKNPIGKKEETLCRRKPDKYRRQKT